MNARAFAAADSVGALANGSACVSVGRVADARRATQRASQAGAALDIRFIVPREGAPMSLDALAIPKDAPHPDAAYALFDFLLRPDIAQRNARAAEVSSAEDSGDEETFKRLSPTGAIDPTLGALVEKEWLRVKAAK